MQLYISLIPRSFSHTEKQKTLGGTNCAYFCGSTFSNHNIIYPYCISIVFHFLRSLDLVTASVVNTVLHSLTLSCSTTEVRTTCLLCHLASSARGPL